MAKRMILMVALMTAFIAGLGFIKFRQFQAMAQQFAAMQPPPDAVTTIVAAKDEWPNTLNAIGTIAAVQGVTVSADLPGVVDRIAFDSGKTVEKGDVLVQLDTRQEQAQLAGARVPTRARDPEPRTDAEPRQAGRCVARGVRHRGRDAKAG